MTHPTPSIFLTGPLPHTLTDFWRMIWQEEVGTITMVTNLQENTRTKCERYWPEMGSEQHGPFKLTLIQTQTFADYVIREFQMEVRLLTSLLLIQPKACTGDIT